MKATIADQLLTDMEVLEYDHSDPVLRAMPCFSEVMEKIILFIYCTNIVWGLHFIPCHFLAMHMCTPSHPFLFLVAILIP